MNEHDSDPQLSEMELEQERRLEALLRHAFAPSPIDPARHERLLQAAWEDPFAEASAQELVESERLRQALEGRGSAAQHADFELAQALSAAHRAGDSPPAGAALPPTAPPLPAKARGKVHYYHFGAALASLAAAAAVLIAVGLERHDESVAPGAPLPDLPALAQSRSTAGLFQADAAQAPSVRIDRIASTRGRELRDNRYALWGVR